MSTYLSTTDRAATIRQELKRKHGWTSRDVSVRADYYSMGSAIRVVVKNPDVPIAAVKASSEQHESIDRDARTGEILSGGNRFVTVNYAHEACDVLRSRMIDAVRKAADTLNAGSDNCLIDIEGTPYMLGYGSHGKGCGFSIWKRDAGHQAQAMDENGVALYVAIGGWND